MEKQLKTAQVFSSNMVLQREKNIVIWGEGKEGSEVTVSINSHKAKAPVIKYKWNVELPKMEAGGPYVMTITDGTDKVVYENVMIGEVWLAGGQSNMELELRNCQNGKEELANANYDNIRFYNTARIGTLEEKDLLEEKKKSWQVVKPETAFDMSAVAYFYAREVSKRLGIAIGIIDCYKGGTSISAWLSKECLEKDLDAATYLSDWNEKVGNKTDEEYEKEIIDFEKAVYEWNEKADGLKKDNPDITWNELVEKLGNNPWEEPAGYKSQYRPAGLYYTMLQRVMPYTIRGFLWYQGEQDENKPEIYDKMLYKLIDLWRTDWKDETLPFYIVQLPMWIEKGRADDKSWAILRDKQRKVAETVANAYLTVLIDCGEFDNIHPLDKQTVGYRLALQVLKNTYEMKDLHADGPKYLQRDLKNGKIVLHFNHVYGGFVVKGNEEIRLFEIAGEDKVFVPADAVIIDNTIEISNKNIKNPKYARYGWTNYGIVNLFNAEGFPVAPFATR